jgi:hypothetical protein
MGGKYNRGGKREDERRKRGVWSVIPDAQTVSLAFGYSFFIRGWFSGC